MKETYLYMWYPLFQGVGQGMKQTSLYLWYPLFQGVGQGMKETYTDTDSSASYLDLHLEIKDTTDTDRSASNLDLHLEIKDTTDTNRSASILDIHPFISRCRPRYEADLFCICGILYFKV
jgi:hypothetical protein